MRPDQALAIALVVFLFLFTQQQQQQLFLFRILYEIWANQCLTVIVTAVMRARNRRVRRRLQGWPYAWTVPRPVDSWFEHHYYDPTIPQDFFRQQLRVTKNTFDLILNVLGHRLVRQNSRFRAPLPPEN